MRMMTTMKGQNSAVAALWIMVMGRLAFTAAAGVVPSQAVLSVKDALMEGGAFHRDPWGTHDDVVSVRLTTSSSTSFLRQATTSSFRRRRLQQEDEFEAACDDPGILYETADADETATGLPFTSVSCNCNGTTPGFHIVSCLLYPVTCRNDGSHLCLGERDVWLFDVVTGQLEQRATCLDCTGHVPGVAETVGLDADLTAAACEEWQDTCFLAQYGNHDGDTNDNGVEDVAGRDDMTSCSLVYTELDVECTQCDPCTAADRDDGQVEWGMIFDCPGWNSRGDCVTSSRLGHHPWDVVEPLLDPDSSTQSTTAPTGSPPTSSVQRNNDDDNDDDKDAQQLLIIMAVVAGVAVFCCGIFLGRLFLGGSGRHDNNRRRRETMAADDDDGMGPAAREGVGYENNDDQATEDDESSYQSASVYDDTTTAHHAAPAPTLRDINIADKLDTTGSTDDSFAANL